ncbi:MAG: TetR/AcrR family transcriptional regulator [Chloroflexota bacterium]|nr:TetR/AcrR family transcriptional regulator [Chloroflexota bacterium]
MSTTREQIIDTTSTLLESQGYHATGLNQILTESGAPKGSLYYYFPQGKEELTAAAIEQTGKITAERIRAGLAKFEDATEAIQSFVHTIAYHVEASGFSAGGPLMIVAMETVNSSERLNNACREAYKLLLDAFQEKLVMNGLPEARATQLATFIVSAVEGATILSRVQHSGNPLRLVAEEIGLFLKSVRKD